MGNKFKLVEMFGTASKQNVTDQKNWKWHFCAFFITINLNLYKDFFFTSSLSSVLFKNRPNLSLYSKAFKIYDSISWTFYFQVYAQQVVDRQYMHYNYWLNII